MIEHERTKARADLPLRWVTGWFLISCVALMGGVAACGGSASSDRSRPPGHAANAVRVVGERPYEVRAEVLGWRRVTEQGSREPNAIDVTVRLADSPTAFSFAGGSELEIAVCATTDRRRVVSCGMVTTGQLSEDPALVRVERVRLRPASGAARVLLLPDQWNPTRVPRSVDPRDGTDYVPPRFPAAGERLG